MNYWNLYDEIIDGLPQDIHIDDYAVGRPWTYVRAGDLVGICMTIPAYSRPRLRKESFLGCSLREAGEYVRSWQGQEASIAAAAINAFYNQPSKVEAMQGFHGEDASAERRSPLSGISRTSKRTGTPYATSLYSRCSPSGGTTRRRRQSSSCRSRTLSL